MEMWIRLGVRRERITMVDVNGVLVEGRPDLDEFRAAFARPKSDPRRTLGEAVVDADVLIGLSAGGVVTPAMLRTMARKPIIFALANPDPEIGYDEALQARPDAVVATGRSDFPNQVNNVLGFPFIFRGALDVHARGVSEEMKVAAAEALAELARAEVPDEVLRAYGQHRMRFGRDYLIPKPFDSRVLYWVAPAVAGAAIRSGMARATLDLEGYQQRLYRTISPARRVLWNITEAAKTNPKRIVFPEGDSEAILRAAHAAIETHIAQPILLGHPSRLHELAERLGFNLEGAILIEPRESERLDDYVEAYWQRRQRRGVTRLRALKDLRRSRTAFGMMMVARGDADGLVAGVRQPYAATIRPALQLIGVRPGVKRAAGMYMVITKQELRFLADTTINIEPDAEALAEIAILVADAVSELGVEPRVAMLSFSNFGDAPHVASKKVAEATAMVQRMRPQLMIDGEMQANVALDEEARNVYPFCKLKGPANVLIFPNLDAGNAAYKLLAVTGQADVIGPMVLGLNKPVNVLQQGAGVDAILHLTAITAAQATRLATGG
jgi:malate dehydrogenase (oxaloacetate-decarboxylating)(NADP+)